MLIDLRVSAAGRTVALVALPFNLRAGLVLPFFAAAELVGGFTIGRFVDAFGRSMGLALGSAAMASSPFAARPPAELPLQDW